MVVSLHLGRQFITRRPSRRSRVVAVAWDVPKVRALSRAPLTQAAGKIVQTWQLAEE